MALSVVYNKVGVGDVIRSDTTSKVYAYNNTKYTMPVDTYVSNRYRHPRTSLYAYAMHDTHYLISKCDIDVLGKPNTSMPCKYISDDINISSYYHSPTIIYVDEVADNTSSNANKLSSYLTIDEVKPMCKAIVLDRVGSEILNSEYRTSAIVYNEEVSKVEGIFSKYTEPYSFITELDKDDRYVLGVFDIDVVDSNKLEISNEKTSCIIDVEDGRPLNMSGGSTATSGGFRTFNFTVQPNAFFEFDLSFQMGKVKDTLGLPAGLIIDNGKIKGTPIHSGTYPITLVLDNGATIIGNILVPNIKREK